MVLGACAQTDDTSAAGSEDIVVGSASDLASPEATSAAAEPSDESVNTESDDGAADELDAALDPTFPLTGTLEVMGVEGGCLVLTVGDTQYEILADPSAELAVDTANGVVVDAGGEELARAGDEVTVDGAVDTGVSTFCQVGPPLFVTAVSPT